MPQCIAQQDTSSWLGAMTKCTSKQCTRHFGVFCTHHQWLTQLTCLNTELSADVLKPYLPFCSRSVLAKAQLLEWIHATTGRTWLVDVGDGIGLQYLSPSSLTEGHASVDVTSKAPTCLTDSTSAHSNEQFQHVMASCGFTAYTEHTGNAARSWEYSESLGFMTALDSETAGYDLTSDWLPYGNYFDKHCFCESFSVHFADEPCLDWGLTLTKERLWLYATCGSKSLPTNWKADLKTTEFDYIPTKEWQWPTCVNDMPKKVLKLHDQCMTDACDTDAHGYCEVERAVDRSCFCRSIEYDTCKGLCHEFETRMDYVQWLHGLCGDVEGWNGLPKHWRELAGPTSLDMIPWSWTLKNAKRSCHFAEWKIAGLVMINAAALVAAMYASGPETRSSPVFEYVRDYVPRSWIGRALMIVALHVAANFANAAITQSVWGYENVPTIQLVLIWCSLPRSTWIPLLRAMTFDTIASSVCSETILQLLSSFTMVATVRYGWEHNFYNNGMERLATSSSAQLMYAGALMWLVIVIIALVLVLQTMRGSNARTANGTRKSHQNRSATVSSTEELLAPFNEHWSWLEETVVLRWLKLHRETEHTPLMSETGLGYMGYGTLPATYTQPIVLIVKKSTVRLYLIVTISSMLLWIAQWVFWAGFIGLSLGR
jgi:hypothetical protein